MRGLSLRRGILQNWPFIEMNGQAIPLSKGLVAIVDEDDYERLIRHNWSAVWSKTSKSFYARRRTFSSDNARTQKMPMHREVMGDPRGMDIDHKNHDTLDNRKSNLRVVTRSQNVMNQRLRSDNRSGVTGVCWYPANRKWGAHIRINGKRTHLGLFEILENAVAARISKERELFGEFSYAESVRVPWLHQVAGESWEKKEVR